MEGSSEELSTGRIPGAEDVIETSTFSSLPLEEVMLGETRYSQSAPLTAEASTKDKSPWKGKATFSNIVTSEGGVVLGDDVTLVCPRGAVDNPVTVEITLEGPSRYYGLIVQRDLENDVMFGSSIINLQPNGQLFKKPVTLISKLRVKNFHPDDVLILHGTEARDGKITWQDITRNSMIDETNADVTIEVGHFSLIAALIKLKNMTLMFTKDIVYRLNLLPFHYTMSVLVNKNSLQEELALLFVSQDVYSEQFYQNHETSALVQLKAKGFTELHVRSVHGEGETRVYNSESLKVSVHLGKDYKMADSKQGVFDFTVHSSVWWSTGEVFRYPLEWTEDARMLCGTIFVEGGYGHRSERKFCEMDLIGHVRNLLGVKETTFNLMPIAHLLATPEELTNQVLKSWKEEDEQLEIILQHWLKENEVVKDLATLRKHLEGLRQEGYKVTQRGQMHIRHFRELATKISGLQFQNADSMEYFCGQIQALCKAVLRDCCMELEDSAEGIQRAALSTSYVDYLENHREISKDMARKYRQLCSSSEESTSKVYLSIVPYLIQKVKEIFVQQSIAEVQNGLRGLCEERLEQFLSEVRHAEQNMKISQLVCIVCEVLEQLCHENCDKQSPAELETLGETLAIFSMLNYLKPFFQYSPQDIRLHKRLELFSRHLKYIMSVDFADEVFMRDFSDVSLSLIQFAKFCPSKLVRFELIGSIRSPVSCVGEKNNNESVQYDRHRETFSQWFEIRKESEDVLQLHASALVHLNGRICKKGAFQSVMILKACAEEAFDECIIPFTDVAAEKAKDKDSGNLRVVLCSTQKEKVREVLNVLKHTMREDVIDFRPSEVTQCHLTMRSVTSGANKVVRLRLFHKWRSGAIGLDSKDFFCFADSSGDGAPIPEEEFWDFGHQLVPVDVAPSLVRKAADLGTLDQLRAQFHKIGLGDQPTPDEGTLPLVTSTANSTGTLDRLQIHRRMQYGKTEYHLHQHVTHMQGHVCVVGDRTNATLNDQTPSQCALPGGPSSAPHRSITDGKRSQESLPTPRDDWT